MHFAYIWIVSHLSAKNYRNLWKFDKVLTKTNLLSFFWDTVYVGELTSRTAAINTAFVLRTLFQFHPARLERCYTLTEK